MISHAPATRADFLSASALIPCPVDIFQAVCLVESRGHGFDANGNVVCLVEPHIIWRHATVKERAILKPRGLAYPKWGTLPYGKYSDQYPKFLKIAALTGNHTLAILGTSFGLLQILGENFRECAFSSAEDFYVSMINSEADQLHDAAMLMRSWGMSEALASMNWTAIAKRWNGTGQYRLYAAKLEAAYDSIRKGSAALVAASAPVKVKMDAAIKNPAPQALTLADRVKFKLNIA